MPQRNKKCSKCGVRKSDSEFHRSKISKDGLSAWCKECLREYNRQRYYRQNEKRVKALKKQREQKKRLEKGLVPYSRWKHIDCRPDGYRSVYAIVRRHSPLLVKKSKFKKNSVRCGKNCPYWHICNNK